jgi:hypothetical protein
MRESTVIGKASLIRKAGVIGKMRYLALFWLPCMPGISSGLYGKYVFSVSAAVFFI